MKRTPLLVLLSLLFALTPQMMLGFGKNKVQYKNFTWYYLQSKHFDIYFYEGGQEIAEFTAAVAETAYVQLQRDFRYNINERIVFILYNSHNDWQQTNVVISYLTEGIGGVTELYKNRIVVPFEGSYEQFRHVIHHELVHAVMNDMLYGGSVQSLIVGEVAQAPLWFSEGLAEFQSNGWTTDIDMVVRDYTLNGFMPDLPNLSYVSPYQGGASVFRFIASTYGRKKVSEMLHKMRGKVTFERVLRSAIGVGYEEFTEKWHRYLRKQYWPEVADRKEPVEIAKRLTNHAKVPNYLNVSPTISPNGDQVAFISDRKGYQNIYLMSALDGRITKTIVSGQRSQSFEELHFLRPGMSFSPDGKKLVFAAKSGPIDAIYVADVKSGDVEAYDLVDLDGAFTTAWSPNGTDIAFIGNKDGQSDLFVLNLNSGETTQLTNDVFTDDHPSWSSDGSRITFVSDRKNYLSGADPGIGFGMSDFDYAQRDVYTIDAKSGQISRITDTPWIESTPIYSPDGSTIAYISDKNGIKNLFVHPLDQPEGYAVTNIISGVFQINWDRNANKMVFTTFYQGGFDIFVLNNPLELEEVSLTNTQFRNEMSGDELPVYARLWEAPEGEEDEEEAEPSAPVVDYSNYVFSQYHVEKERKQNEGKEAVELSAQRYQDDDGNYRVRKYKLKFSPDVVTGSAGYNTFFGFSGYTSFAFSDLLGDHKIFLNVNLVSDLKNSDLSLLYLYLKKRMSFGFGGYHQAWFFDSGFTLQRYRNYGFNLLTSYPFSKFNRLELNLNWYNVLRENLTFTDDEEKVSTVLPAISYVHDSVLWGYTGPVDGSRYSLTFLTSPKYSDESRDFRSLKLDYRKYKMLNREYSFAFRAAGGASFGNDPQRFFLGGIDNWINYEADGGLRADDIGDVFFSEFITPLRGARYYETEGNRYALANLEFRFPLIRYLGLGFPPMSFFNVRGTAFFDIGTAFDQNNAATNSDGDLIFPNTKWRATTINGQGQRVFKDLVGGYGVGARVFLLYFLLRIDVAWPYNLDTSGKPIWYFSLGADL